MQVGDAFDDLLCNLVGTRPAVPGSYLITGSDYHGRVPGDMTEVRMDARAPILVPGYGRSERDGTSPRSDSTLPALGKSSPLGFDLAPRSVG